MEVERRRRARVSPADEAWCFGWVGVRDGKGLSLSQFSASVDGVVVGKVMLPSAAVEVVEEPFSISLPGVRNECVFRSMMWPSRYVVMGLSFLPAFGLSLEGFRMLRLLGCCGTSYASIVPCSVIFSASMEWMITRTGQWSCLEVVDICIGRVRLRFVFEGGWRLVSNETTRVEPGGWSKDRDGGRKLGFICSTREGEVGPRCAMLVPLKLEAYWWPSKTVPGCSQLEHGSAGTSSRSMMKSSCLSAKNSFVANPWSMAVDNESSYLEHERSSLRYWSVCSSKLAVFLVANLGGGLIGGVLTRGKRGGTLSAR